MSECEYQNTIAEVCWRLRSAGRWDNSLGERVQRLSKALEERPESKPFIPKVVPRGTYESAREQLAAVASYRMAVCPSDVPSVLSMCVFLHKLESQGHPAPSVRLGSGGFVVAEWDGRNGGHVLIQHGQMFLECAPKFLRD